MLYEYHGDNQFNSLVAPIYLEKMEIDGSVGV